MSEYAMKKITTFTEEAPKSWLSLFIIRKDVVSLLFLTG